MTKVLSLLTVKVVGEFLGLAWLVCKVVVVVSALNSLGLWFQ